MPVVPAHYKLRRAEDRGGSRAPLEAVHAGKSEKGAAGLPPKVPAENREPAD
jgi:hypothetical protein